jgi:hypothetical protein
MIVEGATVAPEPALPAYNIGCAPLTGTTARATT